jgi:class 3 adenylate cyclase
MSKRLNTEVFHELSMAVNLSMQEIDGDDLEKLSSIKDYQSDVYKKLSATTKTIVGDNKNEWGKAFYASIYKGVRTWRNICISDDELNLFRPTAVANITDEELEPYVSGEIVADIGSTVDGLWGYANRAIFNSSGQMIGAIEVGMDMTSYELSNDRQSRFIAFIAAIICFVILLALVAVLSIIIRQLAAVAGVLQKIGGGQYSARVYYKGRDELGKVSHGFNNMASELERQIAHITNMNACTIRFVPIQFMEYLKVSDITQLKLGDSVQHSFTVLFFDIRAFSINSELMSVSENFKFINEVLSVSGPSIRKYNGFVDKYMGDAAMALFPRAIDGIMAGIEIYRNIVLNKKTRIKVGMDGINIGVGLHTGLVSMGIIGENERLSGTVISKTVNLASRMESLTKQVRAGMLITSATFNNIPDTERTFNYRFIGMVKVAGVNEITGVFDILDALPESVRKRRLKTKLLFESGVRLFHTKRYADAEKRFMETLKEDPSDLCAKICLEETRARIKDPNLQSVFVFEKK